jgi:holo-[acyl-carrier protein] synthase
MALGSELHQMVSALLPAPLGVGVDVVDIADFERLTFATHQRFYERCFTAAEIAYCTSQARSAQHFAACFAAKEAVVKAISGRYQLAYWQTEVGHESNGRPFLRFWNDDRSAPLECFDEFETRVSLSHADGVAAAVVVIGRKGQ